MDRREAAVVRNVRSAIESTGRTLKGVAAATDVPLAKLVLHPSAGGLSCDEIAAIGGFLRLSPSSFFEGVAA
jgi:hypothetical protein